MKLVIAEKPSVAMALASVLRARTRKDGYVEGNGFIVSWCIGHLVGLCDASEYDEKYKKWRYEDLPIVPECWRHKVLDGTKKQYGILKKLMRDSNVDEVICATDAGREGELIFRLVYEQAGCKKPMKRLWISSMEEQAIKDGFASLKVGDNVLTFESYGVGVYSYNRDATITIDRAVEVPDIEGVKLHNTVTVMLNGHPGIEHVINNSGYGVKSSGATARIVEYENGEQNNMVSRNLE